jgi:hypothetical protein
MIKDGANPHRALVALSKETEPIKEDQVWARARRDERDATDFYESLNALRNHNYVVRSGPRGGYRWAITEEGRKRLKEGT